MKIGIKWFIAQSLFVASLLFATSVSAGTLSNWEFIYENDEYGSAISGNISDLVDAIKQGKDIKVVCKNSVGATFSAPGLTSGVSSANIVWLKYETVGSNNNDGDTVLIEDNRSFQLFKTNGKWEVMTYNMAGNSLQSHNTFNMKMKWYVNK